MSKKGITFPPETKVQQGKHEETKLSNIVNRYANGVMPANAGSQPMYIDMYNMPAYHEAQNIVADVSQKFAALPSKIRARFNNKPENMIKFVDDDKNLDEAVKMGLVPKPEERIEKTTCESPGTISST